jgi:hypothetical protein
MLIVMQKGASLDCGLDFSILMTHKYRGYIVVLSINKSLKPNEEQKMLTSNTSQTYL